MPYKKFFIKKSAKKSNIKNILYKQLLYKICLQKSIIKKQSYKTLLFFLYKLFIGFYEYIYNTIQIRYRNEAHLHN